MQVAVFGAYGHTGRFVVAELRERGYEPLPVDATPGSWRPLSRGWRSGWRRSTTRARWTGRWPGRRRWSTAPGRSPRPPAR
ncbi:hypothetical protein V2I01_18570 [Micromonospora sp. BRA006-A]|nr:hypothetical protein [Micromonospora sp. BRA006-A]